MSGPTLRELFKGDPEARVLRMAVRQEDDFGAFNAPSEASVCLDAPVVEGQSFDVHDVPENGWSGFTHFLDGAQKSREAMFHGLYPVHLAHTSAALLERLDAKLQPPQPGAWVGDLEAYAPPQVAARLKDWMPTCTVGVVEDDTGTSMKDKIAKEIGRQREQREVELAVAFVAANRSGFLLIDGGIGRVLQRCPAAQNVVGIVKTHGRQYFQSRERVEKVLAMRAGQRTSVFERPEDGLQGARAFSFYLKLRDGEYDGPMFGIVRIEMPPTQDSIEKANEIAGWVLHERDPLSLPDRRHDRLLYPIHLVELQLKARQPSDAAIAARIG